MPNIIIKLPKGSFAGESRATLMRHINSAAATAEQMPDDPGKQFLTWVLIDEVEPGMWSCGGIGTPPHILPCMAVVYVPAGVLNHEARAQYVKLVHAAFQQSLPSDEKRHLVTSVILQDVADGTWGANGALWMLPDFAKAAGYAHLQHLAPATP